MISIVCHLETELLVTIGFYMAAILKIQYGRQKYCEENGKIVFWIHHIVNFLQCIVLQMSKQMNETLFSYIFLYTKFDYYGSYFVFFKISMLAQYFILAYKLFLIYMKWSSNDVWRVMLIFTAYHAEIYGVIISWLAG